MELRAQLPFARLDPVTYLPNRQQFTMDYAKPRAETAKIVLVTLADANHFNQLLRALGHDYGDDFIRTGAARIRATLPAVIELYHISTLSFAFICPSNSETVAASLLQVCAGPLICGGIPILTKLGIGIAACEGEIAADSLRNAAAAAQDSRSGGPGWAHYDRKSDSAHRRSFMLLADLPAALAARDQLTLDFQPKYALTSGRPTSAEALLRWHHPSLGLVPPVDFVPLAENTALIQDLTRWVIREAVAQAARWHRAGLRLAIAINVSPLNLTEPGFASQVTGILKEHQVSPATIELEFTESVLASGHAVMAAELRLLRDAGIHIALDDFGTGFSSLSYIAEMPANILKIDKSFIRRITLDERAALLVRAIIQMGHRLNYTVVAEGIETAEAYRLLSTWGCDEGQGYFMSRPLHAVNFATLFQESAQDIPGGRG